MLRRMNAGTAPLSLLGLNGAALSQILHAAEACVAFFGNSEDRDVAPNFYPVAIGVWWSILSSLASVTAVRGAKPSVQRSAAERRCAA